VSHSVELAHYSVRKWSRGAIFAQLVHDMNMTTNYFIVIEYLGPSFVFAIGIDYAGIFCDEKGFELYRAPRGSTAWLLKVYKISTILEKTAKRWL